VVAVIALVISCVGFFSDNLTVVDRIGGLLPRFLVCRGGAGSHFNSSLAQLYGNIRPLCELPAAQQLSSEQIFQLLQAAVQYDGIPWAVYQLLAAQHFSSGQMFQLLQAGVQHGRISSALCKLPSAQQLGTEEVFQLLQTALQHCNIPEPLYELPAAQQLSSG
jgi:hypothetical protein